MIKRPRMLVELTVIATIFAILPLETASACPWRRCCNDCGVYVWRCYKTTPYDGPAAIGRSGLGPLDSGSGDGGSRFSTSPEVVAPEPAEAPRAEAYFQPMPEAEPAAADEREYDAPSAPAPENFFPPRPRGGAGTERKHPSRDWVDNTGRFQVRARLVQVLGDKIRLLKENGRFATVPLNRLGTADINYVASLWVDNTGKVQVEARLVSVQHGKVQLTNESGESITVSLFRLSAANRKFVEELLAAAPSAIGEVARR